MRETHGTFVNLCTCVIGPGCRMFANVTLWHALAEEVEDMHGAALHIPLPGGISSRDQFGCSCRLPVDPKIVKSHKIPSSNLGLAGECPTPCRPC